MMGPLDSLFLSVCRQYLHIGYNSLLPGYSPLLSTFVCYNEVYIITEGTTLLQVSRVVFGDIV